MRWQIADRLAEVLDSYSRAYVASLLGVSRERCARLLTGTPSPDAALRAKALDVADTVGVLRDQAVVAVEETSAFRRPHARITIPLDVDAYYRQEAQRRGMCVTDVMRAALITHAERQWTS